MEVTLASLTVPDLDAAVRQGESHPLLGFYLRGGSYCPVEGEEGEILNAGRASGLEVLLDPSPVGLASAGERGALCLIVTDGSGRPLAIFHGRSLPVLGAIPACSLGDLRHTWTVLGGGTSSEGRHLLHEQPEEWDPQIERQLTQRLRQLYGE